MSLISWYKNRQFLKPKSYHVSLRVDLPKTAPDSWLVLPYPTNTSYQTVDQLQITAAGEVRQHDFFYAVTKPTWAEWDCQITVEPRQLDLVADRSLTLADYGARFDGEFYCQPDPWVQSHHPSIQQRAKSLQQPNDTVIGLIEKLFKHTLVGLQYGDPIQGLYTTTQALERNCVDCGGFSTYLAALCRTCQIPARIVSGFWAGYPQNDMHAWLECLLPDGQWLPLDPSVAWLRERGRTRKLGGFNCIGSDRIVMNAGSHHEINLFNQLVPLGIIQTPLLIHANGRVEYLTAYQLKTV